MQNHHHPRPQVHHLRVPPGNFPIPNLPLLPTPNHHHPYPPWAGHLAQIWIPLQQQVSCPRPSQRNPLQGHFKHNPTINPGLTPRADDYRNSSSPDQPRGIPTMGTVPNPGPLRFFFVVIIITVIIITSLSSQPKIPSIITASLS